MGAAAGAVIPDSRIVHEWVVFDGVTAGVSSSAGYRHAFGVHLPTAAGLLDFVGDTGDIRAAAPTRWVTVGCYAGSCAARQSYIVWKAGMGHSIIIVCYAVGAGKLSNVRGACVADDATGWLVLFENKDHMVEVGKCCRRLLVRGIVLGRKGWCNIMAAVIPDDTETDAAEDSDRY